MVLTLGADRAGDAKEALAGAEHRLVTGLALLERHAVLGPSRLIDDETVARVRALAGDLARQLAGEDHGLAERLRDMLLAHRPILLHLHALAIETRLTIALAVHRGLDPVLPPLVEHRLDPAAAGHDVAALAAAMLAAQSRIGQCLRQMRLPIDELPADLQHLARATRAAARAEHGQLDDATPLSGKAEPETRLGLLRRLLASLGDDITRALQIDQAGLPLFLSALALASGHPRERVALALAEDHAVRLALLLRAAGLSGVEAAAQLLAIRPEADAALVMLVEQAGAADALLGEVSA